MEQTFTKSVSSSDMSMKRQVGSTAAGSFIFKFYNIPVNMFSGMITFENAAFF